MLSMTIKICCDDFNSNGDNADDGNVDDGNTEGDNIDGDMGSSKKRPRCFCAKDCLSSLEKYTWWYTLTCTGGGGL